MTARTGTTKISVILEDQIFSCVRSSRWVRGGGGFRVGDPGNGVVETVDDKVNGLVSRRQSGWVPE